MAFGRPGKGAALLYLGSSLGGLAIILCAEPFWVRILGVVVLSYSLFCLLITGAFLELLPATGAGSWTPRAKSDLPGRDGRQRVEIANQGMLEKVPIFQGGNPVFLRHLALMLKPVTFAPGDLIIKKGDVGNEMYFLRRGQVEILDGAGARLNTLGPGEFFGELSLLFSTPHTATVRAMTPCDLFVLNKAEFLQVLKDYPTVAASIQGVARACYGKAGEIST
jgi:hypothetical protein